MKRINCSITVFLAAFLLSMSLLNKVKAQTSFPTQNLRGEIRDASTGELLPGATLELKVNDLLQGSVADC